MTVVIPEGTPTTAPIQISKWLYSRVLLDAEGLRQLLEELGELSFHPVGTVIDKQEMSMDRERFVALYAKYVDLLRKGELPDQKEWNRLFAKAMTCEADALFYLPLENNKAILRAQKPVIQIQHHTIRYSKEDGQIRSGVMGEDSVSWGLQFAIPQLYLEPTTREVVTLKDSSNNFQLFQKLQRWLRKESFPATFLVEKTKRLTPPIRIGKGCDWIDFSNVLL
jgi:hypothetical protein